MFKSANPLRPSYKWEMLTLLSLAFFLNQADRAIYGVVLPHIREDLGLTASQVGLVGTILFWTMGVMIPFAGFVGDRVPKAPLITFCLFFWSISTLFTGAVGGILGLILLRSVATGGSEAFYAPSAYALMAKFHTTTRSIALSIHQAAFYTGIITSGFLAGGIAEKWGWRHAFYIYGGCGVVLGVVFLFRLRDTRGATLQTAGQAAAPQPAAEPPPSFRESFLLVFRVPTALLIACGFAALNSVHTAHIVFGSELFLEKFPKLSLTQAGFYSMSIHYSFAFVGIIAGAALSDWMVRRRPGFRLEMQTLSMILGAPAIVWMGLSPDLFSICAAMAVFGLMRGFYESNTQAALFDVIPPRFRAMSWAVVGLIGLAPSSFSPLVMGMVKGRFPEHGYACGFACMGILWVLGAIAILVARTRTFKRDRIALC
ncbi:MAG: MFS transporter [Opitutaceae bacterium]|jgi:MFS family permease|nr:MFS transporter [Opitutaceae bacterium]